jgi:hypothetical protein
MRAKRVMQAKLSPIQVNMYPVTGFAHVTGFAQGLKPDVFSIVYGPTKVVP